MARRRSPLEWLLLALLVGGLGTATTLLVEGRRGGPEGDRASGSPSGGRDGGHAPALPPGGPRPVAVLGGVTGSPGGDGIPPGEEGQGPAVRLRGTVRRTDGTPVAGAIVFAERGDLHPQRWERITPGHVPAGGLGMLPGRGDPPIPAPPGSAVSGSDGSFALDGFPRDSVYRLVARAEGLVQVGGAGEVWLPAEGGEVFEDIVMGEGGTLLLRWTGPPGQGWTRVLLAPFGPARDGARSHGLPPGADRARIESLPPGEWAVRWEAREGGGAATATVLPGGETEVVLSPGGPGNAAEGAVLAGEVRGTDGLPVPGVRVEPVAAPPEGDGPAIVHFPTATRDPLWIARPSGMSIASVGTTDAAGRFRLRGLPPGGRWWVRATSRTLGPVAAGPYSTPREDILVSISARGSLGGRLVPPEGGLPGGDLVLSFRGASEEPADVAARTHEPSHRRTTRVGDGSFTLDDLPAGPGLLWGRAGGHPFGPVGVVIPPGGRVDAGSIPLGRTRRIAGRTVDAAGMPVAGASVGLLGDGPDLPGVLTAEDGRFLLREATPGDLRLQVFVPFRGPPAGTRPGETRWVEEFVRRTLDVPAGGDADLGDVVLRRMGFVEGTARRADGRPAAGGWVVSTGGGVPTTTRRVDHRGRFSLALPPGEHVLLLRIPGEEGAAARAAVSVEEGRTARVDLRPAR